MAVPYLITVEDHARVEAVLLGSLFLHPETGGAVREIVQLEDFSEERHRLIYEALLTVLGTPEHVTVDIVSILLLEHELESVGGITYLTTLKEQAEHTTMAIEEQAHLLKQAALYRLLHQIGETLSTRTVPYDDNKLKQVVGELEQALRVAEHLLPPKNVLPSHPAPFQADLDDYLSDLDTRRKQQTVLAGIPTGFADLDTITGGLQRSDLIVVASPPAIGKTSFALSIALHVLLKLRRCVGLFSMEAPKRNVIRRLLSMEANLDQRLLRSLEMKDDEWTRLGKVSATLSEAKLWIDDSPNISTVQLYDRARLLVEDCGVELLIVDDVHQMLSIAHDKRYENRVQEIGEISRRLKALARDLDIPVLALAHVTRAYESRPLKKLELTDLRDGSLENDADLVLFLSVAEADTTACCQLATISIAKHRNGPRADLDVCFHPSSTRFCDLQVRPRASIPEQPSLSSPGSLQQTGVRYERLRDIMARVPKRQTKQERPMYSSPRGELPRGDVFGEEEVGSESECDTKTGILAKGEG